MSALTYHQCGPGFDFRSRCHMWVEFVVGSRPCSEGFSPGTLVFLPPQKPTFPNSISIWNQWTNSHFVEMPLRIPIYLFIYLSNLLIYIRRFNHLILLNYARYVSLFDLQVQIF